MNHSYTEESELTAEATDNMLQLFDQHLRETLVPVITESGATDESITDALRRFFDKEEYKVFQWDVLGVYGGAFGLSHNSRKHFILFQTDAIQPRDIKGVRLPYRPGEKEDEYKELIDYLFLGRRRQQPLLSSEPMSFSPEFYWQLARIYQPQHGSNESTPFVRYLQSKRSPYLYCSEGEVSFFLYAWRFLFRHLQKSSSLSQQEIGRLDLGIEEPYKSLDIWQPEFWTNQVGLCPESEWLMALDTLEQSDKDISDDFRRLVRNQWLNWHNRLDANSEKFYVRGRAWKTDWFNLGLLNNGSPDKDHASATKPTETLLSLIRFAQYIERGSGDGSLATFESAVVDSISSESVLDCKTLRELDWAIQKVVLRFLRGKKNGGSTLASLLSELHAQARFPILPLFYWTAVDRRPKEHFVFPIWESWRFPVEVKVPGVGSRSPVTFTLPAVGLALIAIRPMRLMGLSGFHAMGSDRDQVYSRAHRRLFRTERFFARISRPIIDGEFYGTLIRDAAHKEGRAEQIENWAHALQTKLVLLQQLYDKLSAESGVGANITVPQESWRNIGGSLRSLRRTIVALSYYRRVREFLEVNKRTLLTLEQEVEGKFSSVSNRGLGHLFLDAFHLMAAKVRLGEEKYGDLDQRLPSFKEACENSQLPPLMTQTGGEYAISKQELSEFFPTDKSVRLTVRLPEGTSLGNFEVWQKVLIDPHNEALVFYFDAVAGVVIDEMLSNALKHVNTVDHAARIDIDVSIEADKNLNPQRPLSWAVLRITNTAAFEGLRDEIPANRSLLDLKDSGLGLFFNRELSQTLTGDLSNYLAQIDPDCRNVISTFRFPVIFRRTLTKAV